MSLELHTDCRQRLQKIIADQLPLISVHHQLLLDRASSLPLRQADDALPRSGQLRTKLEKYISDTPVYDFISGVISKDIYDNQSLKDDAPSSQMLTELDHYNDSQATATYLIDQLASLPWTFCFTIRFKGGLAKLLAEHVGNYSISDSLSLIRPDADHNQMFPLQSGIESRDKKFAGESLSVLRIPSEPKWDTDASYLQIMLDGYVDNFGTTNTTALAIDTLKSFCGLGIAFRLFKSKRSYHLIMNNEIFRVHQKIDDEWRVYTGIALDGDLSNVFRDLEFDDVEGTIKSSITQKTWLMESLQCMKCVFSSEKRAEKILLASKWLCDSHCGKNELLSFVQLTVVLEILLGDKATSDLIGLGELLRNRCAYLIGQSHNQRSEVLTDFNMIYDVRCKIVHRGKSKLSNDERELFYTLKWMCNRVIQEEAKLLKKDVMEDE